MGFTNKHLNEELKKKYENHKRDMEAMSLSYHDSRMKPC